MLTMTDSVKVRATRAGHIYTAPGEAGEGVRDLVMGEKFRASMEREGRWAKLYNRVDGVLNHVGFTKAKRLSLRSGANVVLTSHWGYVDPKYGGRKTVTRGYAEKGRFDDAPTTPVKIDTLDRKVVASGCDLPVANEGHLVASEIIVALNELAETIEKKEGARLEEPSRSRFTFFDRFLTMRERNHTSGATQQSVDVSASRYRFGSTLVRWSVAGATLAYVAYGVTGIFG